MKVLEGVMLDDYVFSNTLHGIEFLCGCVLNQVHLHANVNSKLWSNKLVECNCNFLHFDYLSKSSLSDNTEYSEIVEVYFSSSVRSLEESLAISL